MPSLPARARRQACVFLESNTGAEPGSRGQGSAASPGVGEPAAGAHARVRLQPQSSWLPPWDTLGLGGLDSRPQEDAAASAVASAAAGLHGLSWGSEEHASEHGLPGDSMGSLGRRQRRRGASVLVNGGSGPLSPEELDDIIQALPPPPALATQGSGVLILLGAGDLASSLWERSTGRAEGGAEGLISQVSVLDILEAED